MNPKPRIFISCQTDRNLSPEQKKFKRALLKLVISSGFDPQEFHVSGLPRRMAWNFERAVNIMSRCHGAIILALPRWEDGRYSPPAVMPTEFNHFEGALALSLSKEILIIREETVMARGIVYLGGGQYVLTVPSTLSVSWFNSAEFQNHFSDWTKSILNRHHVFFGYSGGASNTAGQIIKYLESIGVTVRDWQTNFRPAGTILDEIEEAAKKCLGGVFLFSKDDEFVGGDATHAAPRDNVVFEAGYFMHSVGRERTLIIREEGAKMPADLGGGIYLPLRDRNDTSTIESQLRQFIETRI